MSRLNRITQTDAVRPSMKAKALLSGPTGSGKTWTALTIARRLVGDDGTIAVIDTERESARTYADRFSFRHLPWDPPYDPSELAETLIEMNDEFDAVIVDSLTHFWRGTGGTLDIADGSFTGWKGARPVQNRLVDILLAIPVHAIFCVRSKMEYLATPKGNGKYDVQKVGMAPIQDDTLMYEMNVAFDLDLEHRLTVVKSRTPAVPVNRQYPAGHAEKAATDYAEWLAGGVPPARPDQIEAIKAAFGEVTDAAVRSEVKARFISEVGVPDSLTEDQAIAADEWISTNVLPLLDQPFDVDSSLLGEGSGDDQEPAGDSPTPPAVTPAGSTGDIEDAVLVDETSGAE